MRVTMGQEARVGILAILLLVVSLAFPIPAAGEETCGEPENDFIWWDGFTGSGVDGDVRAFTVFEGDLVIGGDFRSAGGVASTDGVARWSDGTWTAIGIPPEGQIRAMVVFHGELIIGGSHLILPGIPGVSAMARWDGTGWSSMGTGTPRGRVEALALYQDQLIVAGDLSGTPSNLMAWDGSAWTQFGDAPDDIVFTLLVLGNDLLAGGAFSHMGPLSAARVARWDGSTWHAFGDGLDGIVYAILADGNDIVVGGSFTHAGGKPAMAIARWNGTWHAYGDGFDGFIQALGVYQGTLYAGGGFYSPDPSDPSFLAAWTGNSWVSVGVNPSCNVYVLGEFDSKLLAGGCFEEVGNRASPHLAAWDGTKWDISYSNPANGLDSFAGAFHAYGDRLVVGGSFTHAGGQQVDRIATWDGRQWRGVGTGMNNQVRALTVFEEDLIAGGFFTLAGGRSANRVARWSGTTWTAMGGGFEDGMVFDLLVYGGDLYAAGDIVWQGNSGIARWDGSAWQPLGDGLSNGGTWSSVHAMAIYDGKLIAGGNFLSAGGVEANSIAAWDGSSWAALGSGVGSVDSDGDPDDPWVEALTVFDDRLIVAGNISSAGGQAARHVAAWDGLQWSPVGAGLETAVNSLHVFEDRLIAGGPFLTADTSCKSRIAYWDRVAWKPMGTGVNNFVIAIGDWMGRLYVGGPFTRAGSTTSFGIACWTTFQKLVPVRILSFTAARGEDGRASIVWDVAEAFDHVGFHVYREVESGERVQLTTSLLSGLTHYEFVDRQPPAGNVDYWLVEMSRTGQESWIGPVRLAAASSPSLALRSVTPNPFVSAARIDFALPAEGGTRVVVFDVAGRKVATLFDGVLASGPHTVTWKGSNDQGERTAPGMYFIRLEQNGRAITRRVLRLP